MKKKVFLTENIMNMNKNDIFLIIFNIKSMHKTNN
jgi:hypothetical protein